MKHLLFLLGLLGSLSFLPAQVIQERMVIGAAGAAPSVKGSLELSFTAGEAVIQAPIVGSDTLSQGFWYQLTESQPVNIASFENQADISVFPNPTNGLVYLKSNILIERAEVLDMRGRMLKHESTPAGQVDLSGLAEGVYVLRLYVSKQSTPAIFRITRY